MDDVVLPGFRFHPTDEELVGFYLKKKIQHLALPIELIKQVDIYKYDPWDLPSLAPSGEKEWYFYCPRDRKYRNSARPNRVTGAGFWKATGTDRPIYSSDGARCIGLKKSLVFYRGRAAKGMKTDWMMHEFRLPTLTEPLPPKKLLDKSLPPNEAWAICRIFKKTNSMAQQRAFSHSWVSSLPEHKESAFFTQFNFDNVSSMTDNLCHDDALTLASTDSFSSLDVPPYKPINQTTPKLSSFPTPHADFPSSFMFSTDDVSIKTTPDVASMLFNPDLLAEGSQTCARIGFESPQQDFNSFLTDSIDTGDDNKGLTKNQNSTNNEHEWGDFRTNGDPFALAWDSPGCPSELSTTYCADKSHT